ncbi:MAG: DUF373 family protein [Candidatus Marsarchaeota archaeon]|nr:DUF373 family protein [Candidatus Marsarchaeota archaeon]MCL5112243.1 DUF373 family protein [Candidatus Marsarchaeota archaeon]
MTERVLVLAVDIDNDLYRKTKVTGPVIGRKENIDAATKLILADPKDSDGNTMFEAVKRYDELKKDGYVAGVATITGAETEGYAADAELARQIELVLDEFKADSCLLVTDGESDNRVLPILKTRVKVNSVDFVHINQAPQFEKAYFTLLEKLKEPHYARIVFGIPAALLLLFSISLYFKLGIYLPIALVGIYLILYGFGMWEALVRSFKGLGFSIDRVSFIFYIASIIFFIIALVISYGSYSAGTAKTSNLLMLFSYGAEGFLMMFPISLMLYFIGRVIDLGKKRMRYRTINQGTYIGYGIISLALLYILSAWFAAQIYFWEFLLLSAVSIMFGYGISEFSSFLKRRAIKNARMKNKKVINEIGAYIGRIEDIDLSRNSILVKTHYGSTLRFDIDRVTNITDRVMIRQL